MSGNPESRDAGYDGPTYPPDRELFEWDWAYTACGSVLHHVAEFTREVEDVITEGVASCGLRSTFSIPGVFSRIGTPRCVRCCRKLCIPEGVGSPKNGDGTMRAWVEKRVTNLLAAAPSDTEGGKP